jgi:hypothetical protein
MAVGERNHVFDTDAHVEEWAETFAERYLDPAYARRRPTVVGSETRAYWLIDDRLFPSMVGPGCHILGTPTGHGSGESEYTKVKAKLRLDDVESMELRPVAARLKAMDAEGLDVQVIYPTLFLVSPLTSDPDFQAALCRSYNSWMADVTRGQERLKWVAVTDLARVDLAVDELKRVRDLGALAVMLLGTQATHQLHDARFEPFFAAAERQHVPLAIHVGWSCPPLTQLFSTVWESLLIPFTIPVFLAFSSLIGGGVLDRHPNLKVGFFETGVGWLPYWLERMDHFWKFGAMKLAIGYRGERQPIDYLRSGNLFFNCETDEQLIPQAIDLVGEDHLVYASDMPHGDRTPHNARLFWERTDLSEPIKRKILSANGRRFYDL